MAQLPVMPLYTDALIADTTHLTAAEFGAYMLLLIAMWRSGGSLPDTEADIRRISRIRENHWEKSRDRIFGLFTREGGRITQKRLQTEFERSIDRHERRAAAGRKGGKKPTKDGGEGLPTRPPYKAPLQDTPTRTPYSGVKSLKTLDSVKAMLSDSLKQTDCITPLNYEPVKEEERETIVSPKKKVLPKRGGRIPDDWAPSDADRMYAAAKGLPPARVDREAEAFRNYWMAAPGERGVKQDWPATWRNWILNAVERKPEATAKAQPTGWSLPAQSPGRRT